MSFLQNMALGIVLVLLVGYGLFRADILFSGPSVIIHSHTPYQETGNEIRLVGETENTVLLTVNDRRVYPDGDGMFETYFLLPAGYTTIKVYTRDRRGREKNTFLPLYIVNKNTYGDKEKSSEQEESGEQSEQ